MKSNELSSILINNGFEEIFENHFMISSPNFGFSFTSISLSAYNLKDDGPELFSIPASAIYRFSAFGGTYFITLRPM